jgi:hypothetical protein
MAAVTAEVSASTVAASRAFVMRWTRVVAAFWLVLVPHSDKADKPVRRRMIPPSMKAIFLPIFMFDIDVIFFPFSFSIDVQVVA